MAIAKKLLEIQSSIRGLTKDQKAYNYDYVTGDKLLSHVRPMMNKLGLLLLPSVKEIRTEVMTYDAWEKKLGAMVTKTEVLYHVFMDMTWIDTEDGETLTIAWAASGQNAFDKGYGSALTYGERYYLLKTFHIPTDKDDVDSVSTKRDEALEAGYQAQAAAKAQAVANERYWKYVGAAAKGIKSKSGISLRDQFIQDYQPDTATLERFDQDVNDVKLNKTNNQ